MNRSAVNSPKQSTIVEEAEVAPDRVDGDTEIIGGSVGDDLAVGSEMFEEPLVALVQQFGASSRLHECA